MTISSAGVWAPYLYDLNLSPACAFDQEAIKNTTKVYPSYEPSKLHSKEADHPDIEKAMEIACFYSGEMEKKLLQGFSVFMFSLGILGGIAFDFFVSLRERMEEEGDQPIEKVNLIRTREFAGFFLWVMAILLSSYGLKEPTVNNNTVIFGSSLAIFLWICVNHNKAQFKHKPPEPKNIEAGGNEVNHDLTGEGLS